MNKKIPLKYRIICHQCNKPFNSRESYNLGGRCICPDCRYKLRFTIYGTKEEGK